MNFDKGAEHEKLVDDKFYHRAAQIWCEDEHAKKELDAFLAMSIAKALSEAYAAGRSEVLAEVVEVLEFYAQGGNFQSDIWQHPDLGFFTGKRSRELLQKLKGEK